MQRLLPPNRCPFRAWYSLIVFTLVVIKLSGCARQELPLPAHQTRTATSLLDRCADCHAEIVRGFQDAPHARTLTPVLLSDAEIQRRWVNQTYQHPGNDREYRFEARDDALWMSASGWSQPRQVDWIFGSGHHAQTPVSLELDAQGRTRLHELSVSWYPRHGLDLTLGFQSASVDSSSLAMGQLISPESTAGCFGCHSSQLPIVDGHIDFSEIVPGVSCNRCHHGLAEHVAAADAGAEHPPIERLGELSPWDSIERCGECHRRASEMTADELQVDNRLLVRFATASLVQSRCFQSQASSGTGSNSAARFTCLSCHNPHRDDRRDWREYCQTCLQCHRETTTDRFDCPQSMPDQNCLTCHMPTVQLEGPLYFTDHWIRVRDSSSQASETK